MYTVKGMMILDSNGERLVSKYYNIDGKLRAKNEQLDFERGLFAKTARNNGMRPLMKLAFTFSLKAVLLILRHFLADMIFFAQQPRSLHLMDTLLCTEPWSI
jgi:hypothetical protein